MRLRLFSGLALLLAVATPALAESRKAPPGGFFKDTFAPSSVLPGRFVPAYPGERFYPDSPYGPTFLPDQTSVARFGGNGHYTAWSRNGDFAARFGGNGHYDAWAYGSERGAAPGIIDLPRRSAGERRR
jgi:hypothetical protein